MKCSYSYTSFHLLRYEIVFTQLSTLLCSLIKYWDVGERLGEPQEKRGCRVLSSLIQSRDLLQRGHTDVSNLPRPLSHPGHQVSAAGMIISLIITSFFRCLGETSGEAIVKEFVITISYIAVLGIRQSNSFNARTRVVNYVEHFLPRNTDCCLQPLTPPPCPPPAILLSRENYQTVCQLNVLYRPRTSPSIGAMGGFSLNVI